MQENMTNRLNTLSGKNWVKLTKSVWVEDESLIPVDYRKAIEASIMLSQAEPRDELKKRHPATFAEKDVEKLILFFTKEGEVVLDPFMGTGSAGVTALKLNRKFIGVELYPEWFEVAKKRIDNCLHLFQNSSYTLYLGDSLEVMKEKLKDDSVDFIVTSPPYWNILSKVDRKAKKERISNNLPTSYGFHEKDLAGISDYQEFLSKLQLYFSEMFRVLKSKKYIAVIVSDFRHKERYYLFHADIARLLENVGFVIQGLIILVQNSKNLYAYGYPTTYVPNICNHFVVIARKLP